MCYNFCPPMSMYAKIFSTFLFVYCLKMSNKVHPITPNRMFAIVSQMYMLLMR